MAIRTFFYNTLILIFGYDVIHKIYLIFDGYELKNNIKNLFFPVWHTPLASPPIYDTAFKKLPFFAASLSNFL